MIKYQCNQLLTRTTPVLHYKRCWEFPEDLTRTQTIGLRAQVRPRQPPPSLSSNREMAEIILRSIAISSELWCSLSSSWLSTGPLWEILLKVPVEEERSNEEMEEFILTPKVQPTHLISSASADKCYLQLKWVLNTQRFAKMLCSVF